MRSALFLLATAPFLMTNAYANVDVLNDKQVNENTIEGPSYDILPASVKLDLLWRLSASNDWDQIPPYADHGKLAQARLLIPCHDEKAFTHASDLMIPGRKKLIHSSGSVIKLEWVAAEGHNYTGLFETGSKEILARFSMAKAQEQANIIPGFALKYLIDGHKSRNIMAMYLLQGQDNPSFFDNTFTTSVPVPTKIPLANKGLKWAFEKALKNLKSKGSATHLTTVHLAAITPDGRELTKDEVRAPWRLQFTPTSESRKLTWNASFQDDFRKIVEGKGEGITLYEIYADEKSEDGTITTQWIGSLKATSHFVASKFGDEMLHFQHQLDEFFK